MKSYTSQSKTTKKKQLTEFFYRNISPSAIFEYREKEKHLNAVLLWSSVLAIVGLVIIFYFSPTDSLFNDTLLGDIFNSIFSSIKNQTKIGVFITSLVGGLFFLMFPLEIYYFSMLQNVQEQEIYFLIYFSGFFCAQSLNYWLGLRANRFCKLIIPPRKFYKLKGSLNRWGIYMIFFMNLLPLPSPILSTVLGAFRYNTKRFLVFMGIGSFILYLSMYLIVQYIGSSEFEELSWKKY